MASPRQLCQRSSSFSTPVAFALLALIKARHDKARAQRELESNYLSPAARGGWVRTHDEAARRITRARFDLDQAIDAEGP